MSGLSGGSTATRVYAGSSISRNRTAVAAASSISCCSSVSAFAEPERQRVQRVYGVHRTGSALRRPGKLASSATRILKVNRAPWPVPPLSARMRPPIHHGMYVAISVSAECAVFDCQKREVYGCH